MKRWLPGIAIIVLAGTALLVLILSRRESATDRALARAVPHMEEVPQVPADPPRAETNDERDDTAPNAVAPNGTKILPGPVPIAPRRPSLAAAPEPPPGPEVAPGLTPLTVLENMRSVFRQYNSRYGGNPVGNNPEITAALNGGNPRQIVFLNPEDGARINERGQLIDNWGTPFFFHQLSSTEMEIHSAGPDRKMWTSDDLVIR